MWGEGPLTSPEGEAGLCILRSQGPSPPTSPVGWAKRTSVAGRSCPPPQAFPEGLWHLGLGHGDFFSAFSLLSLSSSCSP